MSNKYVTSENEDSSDDEEIPGKSKKSKENGILDRFSNSQQKQQPEMNGITRNDPHILMKILNREV
jgi:hypothetical protein